MATNRCSIFRRRFLTGIDPATGRRRKIAVPGWLALPLFRVLRHGKHLRGTALDLFGRQHERRMERALIEQYIGDLQPARSRCGPTRWTSPWPSRSCQT